MKKLILRAPVLTASGYGVHSRQILRALLADGVYDVSILLCNWGNTSFLTANDPDHDWILQLALKHERAAQAGQARYDISVQVTIPNEFAKLADFNIGVTAGIETDRVSPEWIKKANENIDLLVVPSQHSLTTFRDVGYRQPDGTDIRLTVPVALCPEGVDTGVFSSSGDVVPEPFELGDVPDFNFLVVGLGMDKPIGQDRKNIGNTIKWFYERFAGDPTVGLVVKGAIVNGSRLDEQAFLSNIRQIKAAVRGCEKYPVVTVVHGRLTDRQMAGLYHHPKVKALVSLTHGEGFGLPILEAAASGLPVIATDWSGHVDFLNDGRSKKFVPVDYDLGEIPASCVWNGVMEAGSRWANPREDHAKSQLKKVQLSYETPKRWALELAEHIRENYSLEKTGKLFCDVLRQVLGSRDSRPRPLSEEEAVVQLRERFRKDGRKTLLYTMPMSAGDVLISTGVVESLKRKYPEHLIYFATMQQYFPLLSGNPDIEEVISFEQWMGNVPFLEQIFDEVFTPNLSIQTLQANWIRRGKGRILANEMAHACDVDFGEYRVQTEPVDGLPAEYIVLNPGSGKGQWEARNYLHWQDVISNVRRISGLPVVQIGQQDDPEYRDVIDMRGKTSYGQLASVVKGARSVIGIDSLTSHLADAFSVPQVSIYGSSYSTSTGPLDRNKLAVLIDTPDRMGCERACYKYTCVVNRERPCVNGIEAFDIVSAVLRVMGMEKLLRSVPYEEYRPRISGYTHVLNPERQRYPWRESIGSMLGFCDEVVVVEGGSDDGTLEELRGWAEREPRLRVYERKWDWSEPGMDGMQKAFGRAMCSGDFLWQQDCDEVVHERDYDKIRRLTKEFPRSVSLMHLPVVELWGDGATCRTDRHTWKWRLSRNDFRITHGINKAARVIDEKTGKTYARKGMSDGCEYVDIMTHEHIPHGGFYSDQLEKLRREDPQEFGRQMNRIYSELPSVYHYSWCDIERKVRNFRDFWDRCWSNLYNDPAPSPRFPDVVSEDDIRAKAAELRDRGGEHHAAETFSLDTPGPAIMGKWLGDACLDVMVQNVG